MSDPGSSADPLPPAEERLLAQMRAGHQWLRAVLCTIARRGVAYRLGCPEAAVALLAALATSPLYKAGQFLFDLMEWEDFMLDGGEPPLLPSVLDGAALARIARLLDQMKEHLESGAGLPVPAARLDLPSLGVGAGQLPPLEAGFFLYQDVVLGALCSVLPFVQDPAPAGT